MPFGTFAENLKGERKACETPCESCPFVQDNTENFRRFVNRFRKLVNLPPMDLWGLISVRQKIADDTSRGETFCCHRTVYKANMTGDKHPNEKWQKCAGYLQWKKGGGFIADIPTTEGVYWLRCEEGDNEPELATVYKRDSILRVSLESLGDYDLESVHNGLTRPEWKRKQVLLGLPEVDERTS